ncbi:helix-turn-helix domain-containing protein [Winogradskyella sp. J14-2]
MNRLIGIKIKKLRTDQNYSQEEVADMLNVS